VCDSIARDVVVKSSSIMVDVVKFKVAGNLACVNLSNSGVFWRGNNNGGGGMEKLGVGVVTGGGNCAAGVADAGGEEG
jgi:hypothetical protein